MRAVRRTVQPPEDTLEADLSNPLTRGLVLIHNGRRAQILDTSSIVGTNPPMIKVGSPADRIAPKGRSYDFAGAQALRFAASVTGSTPAAITMFALCSTSDAVNIDYGIIGQSRSSNVNPLIRLGAKTAATAGWTLQYRGDVGSTVQAIVAPIAPVAGEFVFLVGVFRSGTGQKELWHNGVLAGTDTTNIGTTTLSQTEIGTLQRITPSNYFKGVIPISGIFNRALSAAEIIELSANPWQLLAQSRRRRRTASGVAAQDLAPSLFVNSNAFYAPTVTPGAVALAPALFADADSFYAPTVSLGGGSQDLDPALFVSSNSFHAPTVSGSYALSPTLYADADSFYSATASPGAVNLTPDLYSDTDTFYSATAAAGGNLSPSLYSNANSFHAATVSPGAVDLTPDIYADADSFYSAALTNGLTLSPALYVDADAFHAPTVTPGSVALTPAVYTDSDIFYAPTVSSASINLSPDLFADADIFYGASVAAASVLQPILVINANSFYIPAIGRGAVNLSPALLVNGQTFYTHSISNGADEQYPLSGLTQSYPLVGLTQQYPLS
jgi:hypothetical protein